MIDEIEKAPVTSVILIAAIAIFLAEMSGRSVERFEILPWDMLTQPWRLVSTTLVHANFVHIAFNGLWIWQLGRPIERLLGSAAFLGFVLVTAVVSSGAEAMLIHRGVGLSGVVYGLAAFAYFRGRRDARFRGIVDDSTRTLFIVWFFLCIAFTELGVMRIANVAHGVGALVGWSLGQHRRWIPAAVLAAFALAMVAFHLTDAFGQLPPGFLLGDR